ncbi:hypothetical protein Rsub_01787 [Raphidocelis subcapitata]|uniref:Formate nitrite transporter n=1 Tax=Raphidocelis subcapitata TaxID=307507 RepID=A0A2V0NU26_9CHLO|nr:hypothetical protein Rsub_01787 [Raphidocelis subcapitata]|eukprot:GBF89070.1 hypothetical protein Rsub_01787 [Raphidocelis subcapitata]
MAIALGAPLSARDVIVGNFIPATLGNWVGGAVCVATTYAFAFGRPNKIVTAWFAGLRMPRGRKAAAGGGAGAQRRKLGA